MNHIFTIGRGDIRSEIRVAEHMQTHVSDARDGQRYGTVDAVRGAAIFGVVFIHTVGCVGDANTIDRALVDLLRVGVPIFLVFFGYFAERSLVRRERVGIYVSQRLGKLLVPFVWWSLVYFVLFRGWTIQPWTKAAVQLFSGYEWPGQYFFVVLIQLLILLPALRYIARSSIASTAVVAVTLAIYCYGLLNARQFPFGNFLAIRPFIYWASYPLVGILAARRTMFRFPRWLLLCLLALPFEDFLLGHFGLSPDPYLRPVVFMTSVFTAVIALQSPSKDAHATALVFPLRSAGRNSMAIFLLNPLFIPLAGNGGFTPRAVGDVAAVLLHALLAAVIIALCVLTGAVARRCGAGILVGTTRESSAGGRQENSR